LLGLKYATGEGCLLAGFGASFEGKLIGGVWGFWEGDEAREGKVLFGSEVLI
jgi:hypothetical protein